MVRSYEEIRISWEEIHKRIKVIDADAKDTAEKCVEISSVEGVPYEDLIYVLLKIHPECFYRPLNKTYFLLKIGEECQMLYTYDSIFKLCHKQ